MPVVETLLYLGEINDSDRAAWTRAIEAVDERDQTRQIHLFPEDRTPDPLLKHPTLQLRLEHIELARPRQWGGCWIALEPWNRLALDAFWQPLLPDSQKGTPWIKALKPSIRCAKPEKVHHLLLDQLGFTLPAQPPPEIRTPKPGVETF